MATKKELVKEAVRRKLVKNVTAARKMGKDELEALCATLDDAFKGPKPSFERTRKAREKKCARNPRGL